MAAVASLTGGAVALPAAAAGGFFQRNGLNVHIIRVAGGSPVIAAALASGSVDVAQIGGAAPVSAFLKGVKMEIVSTGIDRLPASLWVSPKITAPSQLKGKTLAITGVGSVSDLATHLALQSAGLKYGTDVKILNTGGTQNALAALKQGEVAGAVLFSPFTVQAKAFGLRKLIDVGSISGPFFFNGLVVTQAYAQQNPHTIASFVKAYAEGIHKLKTDKAFALNVFSQRLKITGAALSDSYQTWIPALRDPPTPDVKGLETVIRLEGALHPQFLKVKLAQLINGSFFQAASAGTPAATG